MFEFRLRVRYPEVDAQGIVFNARYGDYCDVAATEYLRAIFGDLSSMMAAVGKSRVVAYEIAWRSPARFDEVLSVVVSTVDIGTTSYALGFAIAAGERAVADAKIVYVNVDDAHEKSPIPPCVRAQLSAGVSGTIDQAASS